MKLSSTHHQGSRTFPLKEREEVSLSLRSQHSGVSVPLVNYCGYSSYSLCRLACGSWQVFRCHFLLPATNGPREECQFKGRRTGGRGARGANGLHRVTRRTGGSGAGGPGRFRSDPDLISLHGKRPFVPKRSRLDGWVSLIGCEGQRKVPCRDNKTCQIQGIFVFWVAHAPTGLLLW